MIAEQTFFHEGGVKITNTRFIVPSQTYAMSGVTSVKTLRRDPSRVGPIMLLVLGGLALLLNILLGLLLIGGGIAWLLVGKPAYAVVLNSASGESEALASHDATFISRVVEALNEAIIARG